MIVRLNDGFWGVRDLEFLIGLSFHTVTRKNPDQYKKAERVYKMAMKAYYRNDTASMEKVIDIFKPQKIFRGYMYTYKEYQSLGFGKSSKEILKIIVNNCFPRQMKEVPIASVAFDQSSANRVPYAQAVKSCL